MPFRPLRAPLACLAILAGCGPTDVGPPDAGVLADATGAADAPAPEPDAACPAPQRCGGGCCGATEACIDDACCAADRSCGDVCCAAGDTCQAGECRTDCGAGVPPPCGPTGAEVCCAAADVCYRDACTTPGAACDDIYDCGVGLYCEPTLDACLPLPPGGPTCVLPPPPAGVFTPEPQWEWEGSTVAPDHDQVMMKPAVADVSGDGIPDVVFHTFHWTAALGDTSWRVDGVMRAVSGDDGTELWSVTDPAWRTVPGSSIALADIDADGRPEILTCGERTPELLYPLLAFEHDGTPKWKTTDPGIVCGYAAPSVADLDEDGSPEILVRYAVVNADGSLRFQAAPAVADYNDPAKFTTFADVDGDGWLDVVGGNRAFDRTGLLLWSRAVDYNDGASAVADLDADGRAEVVIVQGGTHRVMAFNGEDGSDAWPIWQDVNQGHAVPGDEWGGGPPTIADFDGDGKPEVAAAGGYGYVVFEGEDGTPAWFQATQDLSSRQTGSSVFDFEGDGAAEVVYNDELELHIYRGSDGLELFSACNTSGTLFEYPVIVDVDDDDRAEIIVPRNTYRFTTCGDGVTPSKTGIAVFRDALDNWVRTRRIWNQHTYHVTNVAESGAVPAGETPNWTVPGLNNFRQNVQPWGVHTAPDLRVASLGVSREVCPAALRVEARIVNDGDAGARPGVNVAFYEVVGPGAYTLLGVVATTEPILPGQAILVGLDVPVPAERLGEPIVFTAAVDDDGTGLAPGGGAGLAKECDEANNVGPEAAGECPYIP